MGTNSLLPTAYCLLPNFPLHADHYKISLRALPFSQQFTARNLSSKKSNPAIGVRMATKTYVPEETVPDESPDSIKDSSGIGGHPAGLTTLFFTEMWERFSYYGMRALLLLFMVASLEEGGMAMEVKTAGAVYGLYTMFVYLLALPGGWLADKFLGLRKSVFYGGVLITLGHFCLAFPSVDTFFIGLLLIVMGTGLLKPNIS